VQKITAADLFFMKKALRLARRGLGSVHPNPLVGAVLVKNGRVIGEGAHENYGGPHAEVNAIRHAKAHPAGGALYVTLEPCAHHGKTPPCTRLILRSGIKKVLIAMKDPNPIVSGRGLARLKKAGVKIMTGILEDQASELNKDYSHWIQKKTPYVTLKFAQSLDGKIAHSGRGRWISSLPSRRMVQRIRARADAILIGIETLLADDPLLSIRVKGWRGRQPAKIILDSALRTPLRSKIFSKASPGPVIIATTAKAPAAQAKILMNKAEILKLPGNKGRVDLSALFKILGRRGIASVLVEGGVEVIKDVLSKKLAHEIYCFVSPKRIGSRGVPGPIAAKGIREIQRALKIKRPTVKKVGHDFLIRGTF